MCAAHTKIETCHIQAHEVCRIHVCTMQHTYILHIYLLPSCTYYSIHTAYVHTCTCYTCMLQACCTHNTSILHACCIHKNWLSSTRTPLKKCMQFVCNCLHAACMLYIIITHVLHTCIQMCATSCACMWHACGAEPIFVYAAHMQYGCKAFSCIPHRHKVCCHNRSSCSTISLKKRFLNRTISQVVGHSP